MTSPSQRLTIKLPGLPPVSYFVHPARRGCEHFCFVGALTDACASALHVELYQVLLLAKLALAFGAVGVYLSHAEEALHHGPGA